MTTKITSIARSIDPLNQTKKKKKKKNKKKRQGERTLRQPRDAQYDNKN